MEKMICKGKKIRRKVKLRASAIFPKSVVMRLLTRPTKLLAQDAAGGSSAAAFSSCLGCLEEVELTPNDFKLAVFEDDSAPLLTGVLRVCSDTPTCNGVVTGPVPSLVPLILEVA